MPPKDNLYRARLTRFLLKYDRSNISKIDQLLAKFAGDEEDLMTRLVAKYGPEPPQAAGGKTGATGSGSPTKLVVPESSASTRAAVASSSSGTAAAAATSTPSLAAEAPGTIRTYRERIVAMYQKYQPSKLETMDAIDTMLSRYIGSEQLLMEALVEKYGPEPPMPSDAGGGETDGAPAGAPPPLPGVPTTTAANALTASASSASLSCAASSVSASSTTKKASDPAAQQRLRQRLQLFYRTYNPSEMHKVDIALDSGLSAQVLLSSLCGKYHVAMAEFEMLEEEEERGSAGTATVAAAPTQAVAAEPPSSTTFTARAAPASPAPAATSSLNSSASDLGGSAFNRPASASDAVLVGQVVTRDAPPTLAAAEQVSTKVSPAATEQQLAALAPAARVPPFAAPSAAAPAIVSAQPAAGTSQAVPAVPSAAAKPPSPPPPVPTVAVTTSAPPAQEAQHPTPAPAQPAALAVPVPSQSASSPPAGVQNAEKPAVAAPSAVTSVGKTTPPPAVPLALPTLARETPIAPPAETGSDLPSSDADAAAAASAKRARIAAWLTTHSPHDLGNVDILMTFNVTEADLFAQLHRRYGIPEKATAAQASPSLRLRPLAAASASPARPDVDTTVATTSLLDSGYPRRDTRQATTVPGELVAAEGRPSSSSSSSSAELQQLQERLAVERLQVELKETALQLREAQRRQLLREQQQLEARLRQQHVLGTASFDAAAATQGDPASADPAQLERAPTGSVGATSPPLRREAALQLTMRESMLIARENDVRAHDRQVHARELAVSQLAEQCSRQEQALHAQEHSVREREHAVALLERTVREREEAAAHALAQAKSIQAASNDALEAYAADLEAKLQAANAKVRDLMQLCYHAPAGGLRPEQQQQPPASAPSLSPWAASRSSLPAADANVFSPQRFTPRHHTGRPPYPATGDGSPDRDLVAQWGAASPAATAAAAAAAGASPRFFLHADDDERVSGRRQLLARDKELTDRASELASLHSSLARRAAEQQHMAGLAVAHSTLLYPVGHNPLPPPAHLFATSPPQQQQKQVPGTTFTPTTSSSRYLPQGAASSPRMGADHAIYALRPPALSAPSPSNDPRLSPTAMKRRDQEIQLMLRRVEERESLLISLADKMSPKRSVAAL